MSPTARKALPKNYLLDLVGRMIGRGSRPRSRSNSRSRSSNSASAASTSQMPPPAVPPPHDKGKKGRRHNAKNQASKNVAAKPEDAYKIYVKAEAEPDIMDESKTYTWVEKVEVRLNSRPMAVLQSDYSESDCYGDWIRFKQLNNTWKGQDTDGITYQMFNSNFFLPTFSLANNYERFNPNEIIPSVPTLTQMDVQVTFNGNLPCGVTMVVYGVYTSALELNKKGLVGMSYVSTR